jgi:hypothetical protein
LCVLYRSLVGVDLPVYQGTFPYISYNVLFGGRHTHFDDVESFLYVLLLFFFSYAGPLSASELRKADETGFVQSIGSDRPPNIRHWPKGYADWADGDPEKIGAQKHYRISSLGGVMRIIQSPEFVDCLQNNWPEELHLPITHLIEASFRTFFNSMLRTGFRKSRTEVSHAEFIDTLDKWLDLYSDLEDKFSNCPFKQGICRLCFCKRYALLTRHPDFFVSTSNRAVVIDSGMDRVSRHLEVVL